MIFKASPVQPIISVFEALGTTRNFRMADGMPLFSVRVAAQPFHKRAVFFQFGYGFAHWLVVTMSDDVDEEIVIPKFTAAGSGFDFAQVDVA